MLYRSLTLSALCAVTIDTAAAGEPLLTPGTQLTFEVVQPSRSPESRELEPSTFEATCTLAAIEGGPADFQVMAMQCDRQWRCGPLRSRHALAYTSEGLQFFSTALSAQTTPADGTVIQASRLEHGDPFSMGGQTGFSQCQQTVMPQRSRPGRPDASAGAQAASSREVTSCSAYEVGFTSITTPMCSLTLRSVVPAPAAAQPAPEPAASQPAPEPAAAQPALALVPGEEGQELNLLVGDGTTVVNPIDLMVMNEVYCWASSTPAFHGVQAAVSYTDLPDGSRIEAQIMGSTALVEDDEGYMMCDDSQKRLLGGASVPVSGTRSQAVDVRMASPMPSWPCMVELSAVVMKGAGDMVEPLLEVSPVSTWISCPE